MELNGSTCLQMLHYYGASARSARTRRSYDLIMNDTAVNRARRGPSLQLSRPGEISADMIELRSWPGRTRSHA